MVSYCRGDDQADNTTVTASSLADALSTLDSPQATDSSRLAALTILRKATQDATSPHADTCLKVGAVNVLVTALDGWNEPCKVEAAWCLSNLAAGSQQATDAVAVALPHLIPLLGAPAPLLVEHAAWVVGNLATSRTCRERLVEGGAVARLGAAVLAGVHASVAAAQAASDPGVSTQPSMDAAAYAQCLSTAKVACWATTNLLRGNTAALPTLQGDAGTALHVVFGVFAPSAAAPGQQHTPLAASVVTHLDRELLTELAWLAAYSAAREDAAVAALVDRAALGAGVALLSSGHPPLTLPALRLLGNIAAMGVPAWNEALTGSATLLHSLHTLVSGASVGSVSVEAQERARVQSLEAMWVLSQLALTHAAVLVKQSFLPAVVAQLSGTWAMRSQCLFCLYNILVHGATAPAALPSAPQNSPEGASSGFTSPQTQPPTAVSGGGASPPQNAHSASSNSPADGRSQSTPPFLASVLEFDGVLSAFTECLHKPDLNLVHMGLSVLDMTLRWAAGGRGAVEAAGGAAALEHVALHGPGDSLSVEASGMTAAAEKLSDWASDLFDEFLQEADEDAGDAGTLQLPAGQQTLLGSWGMGSNGCSPSRVPKAANMPAWAASLK